MSGVRPSLALTRLRGPLVLYHKDRAKEQVVQQSLQYLLARLSEASTWASIAAVLAGAGFVLPDGLWHSISLIGIGIAGVAGFLIPEASLDAPPPIL